MVSHADISSRYEAVLKLLELKFEAEIQKTTFVVKKINTLLSQKVGDTPIEDNLFENVVSWYHYQPKACCNHKDNEMWNFN